MVGKSGWADQPLVRCSPVAFWLPFTGYGITGYGITGYGITGYGITKRLCEKHPAIH